MHLLTLSMLALVTLIMITTTQARRSTPRRGRSCVAPAIQNGAAKLKKRGMKIRYKCYRSYSMVGPRQARCSDGAWSPPEVPVCVSDGCQAHDSVENGVLTSPQIFKGFSVPAGSILQVSCDPGHDMVGDSVLWCDGILWNTSIPACNIPYQPPRLSCNFDDVDVDPWCGFSQSLDNNMEWQLIEKSTPTANTGPSEASEGSKYIYIEASMRLENDTARLVSPVYHQNKSVNACLKFSYHMYGVDMGVLRVGQFLEEEPLTQEIIKEFSGNFGNSWLTAVVEIKKATGNFQYFIEGVVGSSYLSDIGVDAIELAQGEECDDLRGSISGYTVLGRHLSPSSCWGRCDIAGSVVGGREEWLEGVCDCQPGCLLHESVECCQDYISECSYNKIEPRMEIWGWIKYSGPIGIITVLFVVGGFLIIVARWRVVRPVRREGEEDIVQMIDQDDERDIPDSCDLGSEEFIDFSLAYQCPLEEQCEAEAENSEYRDTACRKVTMI